MTVTLFAQESYENLFQKAKDAYFKNNFELALTNFEKIQDLPAPLNSDWKTYYNKCLKAYIRSLKKELNESQSQLSSTIDRIDQKDSIYKETNYELESKKNELLKLEAEKTVLQALYTSPYQKWYKAELTLKAYQLSMALEPKERPSELYAAILNASINLGENSWSKNFIKDVEIQHIDFDQNTEKLTLGFSNGQSTTIDTFQRLIDYPDSSFNINYSEKIDLPYPIQDWSGVSGKKEALFVAGPRVYNLNEQEEESRSILAHEKNYIKGILELNQNAILSFGSDNFIKKIDLTTNTVKPLMAHTGIISDVTIRNKNKQIYFTSSNGVLFKINEQNSSGLSMISNTLPNQISKIHIMEAVPVKNTKKSVLLTGQESGELTFYELSDTKTKYIRRFSIHKGKIQSIEQHKDKLYIYAQDGVVSIWDINQMLSSYTYLPISFKMEPMVEAIQFIPEKELILYGSKNGALNAISMDFEEHLNSICAKYSSNNPIDESEETPEFLKLCK